MIPRTTTVIVDEDGNTFSVVVYDPESKPWGEEPDYEGMILDEQDERDAWL